jgi:GTPase
LSEGDRTSRDSGEKAILVSVRIQGQGEEEAAESLDELASLTGTAGADVIERVVQRRESYNPSTVLGTGKLKILKEHTRQADADLVIFDNELTPSQQDRLQESLGAKVLDRTALILDIFAQHARTREGRTQVELAQLEYLLPRLSGRGVELSRLGGGIGTRGPGETKLEADRRRIHRRMRKLSRELDHMESVRSTQRKRRRRSNVPSICLVGYTNSGKSSLLNKVTDAGVHAEDRLFSTLDSTTRKVRLPGGQPAVVSDTVGFIRDLPHQLVASFRSSLEVVREADLLVHIVDASREENMPDRIEAVRSVLCELGSDDIPAVLALNKVDLLEPAQSAYLQRTFPEAVVISAITGYGIDVLLRRVSQLVSDRRQVRLAIPAERGDLLAGLHREGTVLRKELVDGRIEVTVNLSPTRMHLFDGYRVDDTNNYH